MPRIRDIYRVYEMDCRDDGKCSARLPESFFSLCGEAVRDRVWGSRSGKTRKMCDCIILDADENKVTLAELKSGEPKAAMVRKAKYQLTEGMVVLGKMMLQANKPNVKLQLVLFSKQFRDYSATVEQKIPIKVAGMEMEMHRMDCHSSLPDSYTDIKQSELPRV